MDSEASLRAILAKSPPKHEQTMSAPTDHNASATSSSAPDAVLQQPIPDSQHASSTIPKDSTSPGSTSPVGKPLRRASFFKSFRGRSPWDADEDEFERGRKYSTATLGKDGGEEARSIGDVPSSQADAKSDSTPGPSSYIKRLGGGVFTSFDGRSPWDPDDDEFNPRRKYSIVAPDTLQIPSTPALSPTKRGLRRSSSPFPLPEKLHDLSESIYVQGSQLNVERTKQVRTSFLDSEDGLELNSASLSPRSSPPSGITSSPPLPSILKHKRTVSWADQGANTKPSDQAPDDAALRSRRPAGSTNTSSTLSFHSPFTAASVPTAPTPIPASTQQPTNLSKTIHRSQARQITGALKAMSIHPSRDIIPQKDNMWDPEDDEWAGLDAYKVAETFKASYKTPAPPSPRTIGTFAYFGTAVQNTVKSVFTSPTKSQREDDLRDEEKIRDQVEDLGNTYFCDPHGDLCDEVMKQVLLEHGSGTIVANPSPRGMHIVDLPTYFNTEDVVLQHARPRLCDAVATILAHTSQECLAAFLDPTIKEFAYRREIDRSKSGLILIIRREGNELVCGAYHNLGFMLHWKSYVKSLISVTGRWHEVFAMTKPSFTHINEGVPDWNNIKPAEPESKGEKVATEVTQHLPRKLQLSPSKKTQVVDHKAVMETDPKFMLFQSRFLARYMLWDIWYYFDHLFDCRATWEADGVVSDIRLKRERVLSEDQE